MNRLFLCFALAVASTVFAQENGAYSIISVDGRIVDQSSGKAFHKGEKVSLRTMLQFGTPTDRAILVSPSREQYWLELPPASSELTISSDRVIREVKSRPLSAIDRRSAGGLSAERLKWYFGVDTFTVIGRTLKIPVTTQVTEQYDLLFRYEVTGGIEDVLFPDFTVQYNQVNKPHINECFIMLRENKSTLPVRQVALHFVSEETLLAEFAALLAALDIPRRDTPICRKTLHQYCSDVYGTMDGDQLDKAIKQFFNGK